MKRNISQISPSQYSKGLEQLQEQFVAWLQKQRTWLTREQMAMLSKAPAGRLVLALKCVEHDPRVALYRKDGETWYRAATNLPLKDPVTG